MNTEQLNLTESQQEWIEERIAIMTTDGGVSESEAYEYCINNALRIRPMNNLSSQANDLRTQVLNFIDDLNTRETLQKTAIEKPVLPINSLLMVSLRNSAQNHVELTRKINQEIHEAAKHYYSLLCAESCHLTLLEEENEVSNAN